MTNLGFKKITPENWLVPDPNSALLFRINPLGEIEPMTGEHWLAEIMNSVLDPNVPIEVRREFEVARGAMVYGYHFYPLFTLGWEQLFRVADAAVLHKCRSVGCPKSRKTFDDRLKYMRDSNILSAAEFDQWDAIRLLRNMVSHAEDQMILPPGSAVESIQNICERINALFK